MTRPLDPIQEFADVIEIQSGLDPAQIAGLHRERLAGRRGRRAREAAPERRVDDVLEGASRPSGLGFQLGRHIGIERQRRSHIMMLVVEHRDGNRGGPAGRAAQAVVQRARHQRDDRATLASICL